MIVKEEQLDMLWNKWAAQTSPEQLWPSKFKRLSKRSPVAYRFEAWLWDQGAEVFQENKKLGIRFHTEQQAIMFMLKNL